MNKFTSTFTVVFIVLVLSSLLSVTSVYAGRYDPRMVEHIRSEPESRQDKRSDRHERRHEKPPQAHKDKKWRPIQLNEAPRHQNRDNNRHQRRDDRHQRRDNHHQRRDNRHWRDDKHRQRPATNHHRHKPLVKYHQPRHRHGHVVRHLPRGFLRLHLHRMNYYYYDGIFYRPQKKTGYIVVSAPIGAVLSELPRPFDMILVDGTPYYQAAGAYFIDDPAGFRVVANPFQTPPASTTIGGDLFIYPARGQSQEQQSRDRYECHRWGVTQTGFDPSTAVIANDARLPDYRRAMSACLEARGYTVK